MQRLRNVFGKVLGLFVDDGMLALAIVLWLAAVGLLMPHRSFSAVILFLGLAVILFLSVLYRSRKH